MDTLDLAWMAGYLDGEGSFVLNHNSIRLQLDNTYLPSLLFFRQKFGGSILLPKRQKGRPVYRWVLGGKKLEPILELLLPYLREKKPQAQILADWKDYSKKEREHFRQLLGTLKRPEYALMRDTTDLIVIHCTATQAKSDIDMATIDKWHRKRGFFSAGYHFLIKRDGTLETGRELSEAGAHAKGFNHKSVGVALAGGVDADLEPENNFNPEQFETLKALLDDLKSRWPDAMILGHRDLKGVTKACPSFDVQEWMESEYEGGAIG